MNQLYRDFLLPTILGEDNSDILYWAGKKISHQFQLDALSDLSSFFENANFGQLELIKEHKGVYSYLLSGNVVADRLNANSTEFSLEAGVIAETIKLSTGKAAEAIATTDSKKQTVTITAKLAE